MRARIPAVLAAATLASLLVALPAFAADRPRSPVNDKVDQVFARLDADHDGRISRPEAEKGKRLANHFDKIDADRDGYVTRAEDAHDRRHKLVRLTEKGQALIQELRAARVEGVVQRILLLPPPLIEQTIDVLREVTAQLPLVSAERGTTQPSSVP